MAQTALDRVLDDIKTLRPEELAEVRRAIEGLTEPESKEAERERALRVLERSGLVKQVKRPPTGGRRDRAPVPIAGRPLSETIIEERR
jgi:hypothetical protein